ncbi:uncharacterized protein Gasu_61940 [Galdieria sulphuraria]|uniref:Uncharacterized protein n=1 Tax=Galdieria sulphuraria TaxID=130081 RepID=M2VSN7_GALSU|nr:uncharacterized protein Gasu_61940 [Galdieria sulphuraria]EME26161.1 hypothetical protein Gasu_61940 [Galdieria sulphuraria]|eukprot:XP_005702681.1 hypothetical protein Gasu_61940 [Galdieria sulphuraria]
MSLEASTSVPIRLYFAKVFFQVPNARNFRIVTHLFNDLMVENGRRIGTQLQLNKSFFEFAELLKVLPFFILEEIIALLELYRS